MMAGSSDGYVLQWALGRQLGSPGLSGISSLLSCRIYRSSHVLFWAEIAGAQACARLCLEEERHRPSPRTLASGLRWTGFRI